MWTEHRIERGVSFLKINQRAKVSEKGHVSRAELKGGARRKTPTDWL